MLRHRDKIEAYKNYITTNLSHNVWVCLIQNVSLSQDVLRHLHMSYFVSSDNQTIIWDNQTYTRVGFLPVLRDRKNKRIVNLFWTQKLNAPLRVMCDCQRHFCDRSGLFLIIYRITRITLAYEPKRSQKCRCESHLTRNGAFRFLVQNKLTIHMNS